MSRTKSAMRTNMRVIKTATRRTRRTKKTKGRSMGIARGRKARMAIKVRGVPIANIGLMRIPSSLSIASSLVSCGMNWVRLLSDSRDSDRVSRAESTCSVELR